MPIFSGSNKEFLVFDIGNASVGGALVEAAGGKDKPILKFKLSRREEVPLGEHLSFNQLLKNTLQALDLVLDYLAKEIGRTSELPAYVILASPWYGSKTSFVHLSKERPFDFTEEVLDGILKSEMENFRKEISKKTNLSEGNVLEPVESEVIQIKLNGYEAKDPIGQKVQEVSVSLFSSVSHKKVLESIKDRILKRFPEGRIVFKSFPLAYFSIVRNDYPKKPDFLLIDVSGEITEVSLVRGGVLLETLTFPLGRNFVIRRIASRIKRNLAGAAALFRLSPGESLRAGEKEKLATLLGEAKTEWLAEYQKILDTLSKGLYVPGEIFLAADSDASELFASWIAGEQFSQYLLTHEKFRVIPLSLNHSLSLEQSAGRTEDEFLSIGAIFAHKFIGARS